MLNYLRPFLTFSYWLASYPNPFAGQAFWLVAGAALGGVVVAVVLRLLVAAMHEPSTRRIFRRLATLSATMGCLVGVSFFFTQTSTPVLGSRFWFLLWVIFGVVWLGAILRYTLTAAPREREERTRREAYEKYLPKRA